MTRKKATMTMATTAPARETPRSQEEFRVTARLSPELWLRLEKHKLDRQMRERGVDRQQLMIEALELFLTKNGA